MKKFLIASTAADPTERVQVIQNVRSLVKQLPGVQETVNEQELTDAFGSPPRALPVIADDAGFAALKAAFGDAVAIDPDAPLEP
jgi:hypothetical protein